MTIYVTVGLTVFAAVTTANPNWLGWIPFIAIADTAAWFVVRHRVDDARVLVDRVMDELIKDVLS